MDDTQLAMTQLLHEADERARQIRDHYRGRVHEWFEGLTLEQKQKLGRLMSDPDWSRFCFSPTDDLRRMLLADVLWKASYRLAPSQDRDAGQLAGSHSASI